MNNPQDIVGKCNARLFLGDDFGDNVTTIRCQLESGHELPHKEQFERDSLPVIITWHVDERDDSPYGEDLA